MRYLIVLVLALSACSAPEQLKCNHLPELEAADKAVAEARALAEEAQAELLGADSRCQHRHPEMPSVRCQMYAGHPESVPHAHSGAGPDEEMRRIYEELEKQREEERMEQLERDADSHFPEKVPTKG